MKGDYLWDGSGEPDPDIENLERVLGTLRHKAAAPALPVAPAKRHARLNWFAIAAALILAVVVGAWAISMRHQSEQEAALPLAQNGEESKQEEKLQGSLPEAPQRIEGPAAATEAGGEKSVILATNSKAAPKRSARAWVARDTDEHDRREVIEEDQGIDEIVALSNIAVTGFDSEVTKHIEKAQLLLRSFKNARAENDRRAADISYEKRMSKDLLYQNIWLRRSAEARGDLPVGELLSSLEPYLIDIANLPAKPSKDDMLAIKERIEKKEIVATLQVYSVQAANPIY